VKLIRVDEGDEIAAITKLDELEVVSPGNTDNGTDNEITAAGTENETLNDAPGTTAADDDSSQNNIPPEEAPE